MGTLHLTAGMGRPLILSSVEPEAAMRLLAAGRRRSVVAAAALLVVGLGLLATALVACAPRSLNAVRRRPGASLGRVTGTC